LISSFRVVELAGIHSGYLKNSLKQKEPRGSKKMSMDNFPLQFGKLTAIGAFRERRGTQKVTLATCHCSCGVEKDIELRNLKRGSTKSCGCLKLELFSKRFLRHGDARKGQIAPEFYSWTAMIDRCSNPNRSDYKYYGGRGITVCDEWKRSYEVFLAYIGRKPSSDMSIDRINNDGNYEPGNIRWATKSEQVHNRRTI